MRSIRLCAAFCAALLPLAAAAAPFKYEFSGSVEYSIWDDIAPAELKPLIAFGTEFTGSFTYESETPASTQSGNFLAYRGAITSATISFGPGGSLGIFNFDPGAWLPAGSSSSNITFLNDVEFGGNPPYDQFTLGAILGSAPGDAAYSNRSFGINASGFDTGIIPAGQTLLDPLPIDSLLSGFHSFNFSYAQYDESGSLLWGSTVGSNQFALRQVQASVPEPGTWSLLGVGFLGIWLATRRRTLRAS
jgi:PEP-CTERM motif-containing protein